MHRYIVHFDVFIRFTRPERLGSEAKIKCSQCQTYQVTAVFYLIYVEIVTFLSVRYEQIFNECCLGLILDSGITV